MSSTDTKPSGRKQGDLPVEAYTSQQWFQQEQEELFGRVWQFGGFVEDVAEPGDFVTVQAGVHPLLVVRSPDGKIRAFHNICRHRGTQLLRTIGKSKKTIICPYHMAEDIYACEQQFKAMRSPKFSVGATARTMEKSILDFQGQVLARLDNQP